MDIFWKTLASLGALVLASLLVVLVLMWDSLRAYQAEKRAAHERGIEIRD